MNQTKPPNKVIAALSLPRSVPALLTFAQSIVTAMTALHDAESAALARTKGAVAARNDKRLALVTLLQQLRNYVQTVADTNLETSATVIQSAGIAVRKTPAHKPRTFSAEQGAISGSARLVAASAGRRASYEWQYSTDGGKTWLVAPSTLQAKTTVTGLVPGATVEFRYRAVTKIGEGNWSQTVQLIVK